MTKFIFILQGVTDGVQYADGFDPYEYLIPLEQAQREYGDCPTMTLLESCRWRP